jgi:S1-C subfamily serine protease
VSRKLAAPFLCAVLLIASLSTAAYPQSIADVVARAKPAVVFVFSRLSSGGISMGSGFVVDPNGFIVSAQHIFDGGGAPGIIMFGSEQMPASIVASDRASDIVILKVNRTGLPTIPLGNSSVLRQGDEVLVMGYPRVEALGVYDSTVTRGIVGSLRADAIQLDAAMNPGNSGGPVLNLGGEAVGVAVATLREAMGINFAVPINSVRSILAVSAGALTVPQLPPSSQQPTAPAPRPTSAPPAAPGLQPPTTAGLGTVSTTKVEVRKGPILYSLYTNKAVYGPDEQIQLTFTIANEGPGRETEIIGQAGGKWRIKLNERDALKPGYEGELYVETKTAQATTRETVARVRITDVQVDSSTLEILDQGKIQMKDGLKVFFLQDVWFDYATTQLYDFVIRDIERNEEIGRWSLGRRFAAVDRPSPLAANKMLGDTTRWRQLDQNGRPVRPGRYEIIAIHTTRENPTILTVIFQRN